jgi:hypothetical protein
LKWSEWRGVIFPGRGGGRAVNSAHNNYVRCVEKQEVRSEVDELKEMVRMLLNTLAQQKGG